MTNVLLLLVILEIAIALWLLASGRLTGPQGIQGPQGEPGPRGPQGEVGKVHIIPDPAPQSDPTHRFEMLKDGLGTSHFVRKGDFEYEEIINTPGLSLRAPDGSVLEGVQ